jgi:uncharacterized protein
MTEFAAGWMNGIWGLLLDSAHYLILGFILAGVVHVALNDKNILKLVKGKRWSEILKATFFGIPLPLCSCAVLPIAKQIRESGISRGATAAFLVATPQTGIDSIMLTYSLTDPLLTVARPASAFITAITAGFVEEGFGKPEPPKPEPAKPKFSLRSAPAAVPSCCATNEKVETKPLSLARRLWDGQKYAFTSIVSNLATYLLLGYVLAGLVTSLVGTEPLALPETFRTGIGGYIGAILIGVPLYICASSSTPLAASLLVAGFSPGAIMTFLLVGPATNIASIVVVSKILSGWGTVRFILVIVVVGVICGLITDQLYHVFGMDTIYTSGEHCHPAEGTLLTIASSIIISLIMLYWSARKLITRLTSG